MGVIDAIADGCFAVARRPYVILPPVALDLFYWLGGRMTVAPLTGALAGALERSGQADAATLGNLRDLEADSDLFALLSPGISTLLTAVGPEDVARPWGRGTIDLGGWPVVLLAAVGFGLLGILCWAVYLAGLAQVVREEPFDPRRLARRAPVCWLRLLGLAATVAGGLLLIGLPLLILAAVLAVLGLNAAPLLLLLLPLLVWLYCLLALAPEAIAVSEAGPLAAIKLSVRVVRRNFWPAVGLLAATFLITVGFPEGWRVLTRQAAGVPLAIVGNAFLTTGLSAAAMIFYRERLAALDAPVAAAGPGQPGQPRRGRD